MKPAQFVEVPTPYGKVYIECRSNPDVIGATRAAYRSIMEPGQTFNIVPSPVSTDKLEAENMKLRGEIARLEMILTTTAERVSDLSSDLTEFMPWGDMDDRDDD